MKGLMLCLVVLLIGAAMSVPALANGTLNNDVGGVCNQFNSQGVKIAGCNDQGATCQKDQSGNQVCTDTHQHNLLSKNSNDPLSSSLAQDIANTILYAAGIVAFIFLIIGGVRYITATGDPSRIEAAKETVLYAVIGLIVTFLAAPIASYVIKAAGG